jgi:hypothetical protein
MDMVNQIIEKVNTVFDTNSLDLIARETNFIKRERIIKAQDFLTHHLFLELEEGPNSLTDVLDEFDKRNITITKQGLSKRYTQEACDFFKRVLEELINLSTKEHLVLKSVPFVKNIKTVDSSTINLNKQLARTFPGLRNHGATVKLQAVMNTVSNQLHSLEIRPSRESDQSYREYLDCIEKGDLSINDLGYFCIDSFKEIEKKEAFFLSRYLRRTNIYNADSQVEQEQIDLSNCLEQTKKHRIEMNVLLGKAKFKCRLIALRLPPQAYKQRLKNLQEKQRKNGHSQNKTSILDKWTIFVTNLPESVNADTLLTLYSLRWQIELFFKMAKTFLNVRKIKHTNAYKALISLYVSLIAITLLGLTSLSITHKEISFYKAGKLLKKNIRDFFDLIIKKSDAISWLAQKIIKFALKETRPNRPSTRRILSRDAIF